MNDEKNEILKALERLIEKYPNMRFGQLVCNVAQWAVGPSKSATYDVEDIDFLKAANENLNSK